jgi:protein ImuB
MAVSTRRILALWFPRLATDRLQRGSAPSPDPLVVMAKVENALRLTAVDRKAAMLGLEPGMPLANARAMLPALKVVTADESADLKLLAHIADWCDRFTPFVACEPPDMLLLDVTGAAHLFSGEKPMLDQLREKLSRQGFVLRATIAGTAAAARALAHYKDGTIVPPGTEAAAVAPLPVEALNLDPVTTHAFRRAGLKTIGQVSARDRNELTARFGARMVFALDHALGEAEKPISPRIALPDYMAEHRFAEPIVTEDVIRATLHSLAATLSGVLEQHGEGARRLEASFFRADGAVYRIAIETSSALRAPDIIERLFREKLDALADPLDPGFGYDLIRLGAIRAERCVAQAIGFDADANEEKEIRFLVDRLAARFGANRILAFQPNDTHIPEAAFVAMPAQSAQDAKWERDAKEAPRRPLRLFARPEPVQAVAAVPEGPPLRFRWRRALHDVVLAEGPERIAMEWWRHQNPQASRDYFRVEDSQGKRFWLYREGIYERETLAPRWFMHGVFA